MMKASNGNTMQYQLFTDATYSTNWGNTTGSEVTGTSANGINVYVYAQIPALQAFSPSGNFRYSDTVTATLTCGSTQINSTISVQVQEVDTGCGISASDLSFGNYTGTALNATTTIQVGCSNGTMLA
jgi:spore coat protein U-like protein